MNPEGFLLVEGDEGVKEDDGCVGRSIGEGLRWGEGRGGECGVFLDGRVGEGEGRLDVKGEERHFDIEWGVRSGGGEGGDESGETERDGVIKWEGSLDLWTWNQRSLWSGERAEQSQWEMMPAWPMAGRGHPFAANPRPRLSHPTPFSGQPMFSFASILVIITAAVPPSRAFQLHHRVLDPSLPEPSFVNRASLLSDAAGNLRIEPAPAELESAHVTDALYQLALDPGQSTSLWLLSSVKAVSSFPSPAHCPPPSSSPQCHLVENANEHIVLHLPYPGGTPFALEHFLDSVPSDGTCPPIRASGRNLVLPHNVTITVSVPRRPPLFAFSPCLRHTVP